MTLKLPFGYQYPAGLILLLGLALPSSSNAATLTVYSNADNGAGSLRQAIHDASAGDTVNFSVTGTITLTSGQLLIDKNLNIVGPGARLLTVMRSTASGTPAFRIFAVVSAAINISGLSVVNGLVSGGHGAGIGNSGTLTVNDCTIRNNICSGGGTRGGGVYNEFRLTMNRCTLVTNIAGEGGGIFSNYSLLLKNCTLVSNTANTTSSTAGGGGGILNLGSGTGTIHSCTITNNSTSTQLAGSGGGGICNRAATVHLGNSIVAKNTTTNLGADVNGTFVSDGYNFIGKGDGGSGFTATGDQVGTNGSPLDPLLGALQDNGGPTDTRHPAGTSPVVDQGKNLGLTTDQRGHLRPYDNFAVPNAVNGDGSDIGAFEESPRTLIVTNTNDSGSGSLRQAIHDSGVDDEIGFDENMLNRTVALTSGELLITRETTIISPHAKLLTVARSAASGTPGFRIFHVTRGPVSISGLTISNGQDSGGGILNEGLLILRDCAVTSNKSYSDNLYGAGGGIFNRIIWPWSIAPLPTMIPACMPAASTISRAQ